MKPIEIVWVEIISLFYINFLQLIFDPPLLQIHIPDYLLPDFAVRFLFLVIFCTFVFLIFEKFLVIDQKRHSQHTEALLDIVDRNWVFTFVRFCLFFFFENDLFDVWSTLVPDFDQDVLHLFLFRLFLPRLYVLLYLLDDVLHFLLVLVQILKPKYFLPPHVNHVLAIWSEVLGVFHVEREKNVPDNLRKLEYIVLVLDKV